MEVNAGIGLGTAGKSDVGGAAQPIKNTSMTIQLMTRAIIVFLHSDLEHIPRPRPIGSRGSIGKQKVRRAGLPGLSGFRPE
jgi:hypothetical protein